MSRFVFVGSHKSQHAGIAYPMPTTSELQPLSKGISIAVESKEHKNLDAEIIKTKFGECEVVVTGRKELPVMVTYPDIGTNYNSCFKSFFQFVGTDNAFKQFRFVHISPPGMHYGSPDLSNNLSMPDLAEHMKVVLEELKIRNFHAFGCGLGSYVMLDFASKEPNRLLSMTLINPCAEKSWYFDWFYEKCNIWANQMFSYDRWWKEQFVKRWFHHFTIRENTNLIELHEKLFFRLNQNNVKHLSNAFTYRPDITKSLKNIKCRVLLLVADHGLPENEAVAVMGGMKGHRDVSWIKVRNAGVLLTEEAPRCLLHPINLFFAGLFGPVITKKMLDFSTKLQREGDER